MQSYIARRLIQAVVTLFLMSIIIFMLSRLTGDPAALFLSQYGTEEDLIEIRESLGLDRPLISQYFSFLGNALKGDLGRSIHGDNQPAVEKITERFPASFKLATVSLIFSLIFGLILGCVSAFKRGSIIDILVRVLALMGQSMPTFWFGIVLMYTFAVRFHWLPTSGYGDWRHYVLPAVTMSWFNIAAVTRLVRVSMLNELQSEYIKLARIKGLSESVVVVKHALRNSLIPVITFMGTFFVTMISSAVVIEVVFSWPGIGRMAFEATMNRDFPVLQAVVLFVTSLYIIINLFVDILYAYLDPRIKYEK